MISIQFQPEIPEVVSEDRPCYCRDREHFQDEARGQFTTEKVEKETSDVAAEYAGSNKEG